MVHGRPCDSVETHVRSFFDGFSNFSNFLFIFLLRSFPILCPRIHSRQKLLTMLPTEEERSRIQEAQAANPDLPLGSAEQFLLTLASISELPARLKLWAFKLDFENSEKVSLSSLTTAYRWPSGSLARSAANRNCFNDQEFSHKLGILDLN